MASRAGSADLPLHGGRAPKWLSERMAALGAVMVEALVAEVVHGALALGGKDRHPFPVPTRVYDETLKVFGWERPAVRNTRRSK